MFKTIMLILLSTAAAVFAQSNPHGRNLRFDCIECHTSQSWTISEAQMKFRHEQTGFELSGRHKAAQCASCHKNLVFAGTDKNCRSCHIDPHKSTLGQDCQECHNTSAWRVVDITRRHSGYRLALSGVHNIMECRACHRNSDNFIYSGAPVDCFSCHKDDYAASSNPPHTLMNMPLDCTKCHTLRSAGWTAEKFVHVPLSLKGAHTGLKCSQCHTAKDVTQECYGCHKNDYLLAKDHKTSSYPENCRICHNTSDWKNAQFNHNLTLFPLTGAHAGRACAECHKSDYTGTSNLCYDCHKKNYDASVNPGHLKLAFSTVCQDCHTTNAGWKPAQFSVHSKYWVIDGAHTSIAGDCAKCHNGNYNFTPADCFGCHKNDYIRAKDHQASSYPENCLMCHTTAKWEDAQFNHSLSQFPLTGAHAGRACAECHKSGYKGTPLICSACHLDSYNSSVNPDHRAAGISTDCKQCHNTSAWIPSDFKHSATGFTLTGAHIALACSDCHKGSMQGLNKECYTCHQTDFSSAKDHAAMGYPKNCTQCHTTAAWKPANFNHSLTRFTLTGAHINVSCSKCHSAGYTGTSILCYDCHNANYTASSNPGHLKLALSTVCQDCHTTNAGWKPAQFSVHSKYWVIDGAHSAIAGNCVKCHNGNYNNTPSNCYGCHQTDFNNTADPPHLTLAFPQECQQCHTKTAWKPASFNHDGQYFPVYSGKHRGRWTKCSDCHTVNANYKAFSCVNCHEHNKTSMDSEHRGVSGYSYVSSECLRCHPKGSSVRGMIQMHEVTE